MLLVELQLLPPIPTIIRSVKEGGLRIEAHETYQKRSFRNRFDILDAQGMDTISIPLKKGKNEQMPITKVEIAYEEPWQSKMIKKIATAYGKAAFYHDYSDSMFELIHQPKKSLYTFSKNLLIWALETIRLDLLVSETIRYNKIIEDGDQDWRNKKLSFYRNYSSKEYTVYAQTFEYNHGFIPNLSIIDMIFNCGPETELMIKRAATE